MNDLHKPRFRDILFNYRKDGNIQKAMIDIAELSNEVWNEAVEAAESELHNRLPYPTQACTIVRGLKK